MLNDYMSWAAGSDIGAHLPYLHKRAAAIRKCQAIELGVRNGCSTAALLAGLEDSDGHLWSVDVDPPQPPAPTWADHPQWTFVLSDDIALFGSPFLPPHVDLLFIDTSHRYQHTLDELNSYGSLVRAGGVIILHDTELEMAPGSVQPEDRDYPVRRAINDWCRLVFLTPEWHEGCNGLGVIEVT